MHAIYINTDKIVTKKNLIKKFKDVHKNAEGLKVSVRLELFDQCDWLGRRVFLLNSSLECVAFFPSHLDVGQ